MNTNTFYMNRFKILNVIMLALILLSYIFLWGNYAPYRIDDAWIASFIYNDYVKNIRTDIVFGGDIGETQLFGKIYAFTYGSLIQLFGAWTKESLCLISAFFVFLSIIIWYNILVSLKVDKQHSLIICLSMLYIEVFFSTAQFLRAEAFILFLSSVSLMLALSKKYEWSILLSLIAVETHPVGLVSFFMNFPLLFEKTHRQYILENISKITIKATITVIAFVITYVALHYDYLNLQNLRQIIQARTPYEGNSFIVNNFLYNYYFETKYYRHVPELLLILISLVLYFTYKLYQKQAIILHLFLAMFIFAILLGRGNPYYVVLVYPAFLLLVFYTFIKLNRLPLLIISIALFYTPQYLFVYFHKSKDSLDYANNYQSLIKKEINQINKDALPIIGSPNDYFAFMASDFYHLCSSTDYFNSLQIKEAIVIVPEASELEKYYNRACDNLNNIKENYKPQQIKVLDYMNKSFVIYKISQVAK